MDCTPIDPFFLENISDEIYKFIKSNAKMHAKYLWEGTKYGVEIENLKDLYNPKEKINSEVMNYFVYVFLFINFSYFLYINPQ